MHNINGSDRMIRFIRIIRSRIPKSVNAFLNKLNSFLKRYTIHKLDSSEFYKSVWNFFWVRYCVILHVFKVFRSRAALQLDRGNSTIVSAYFVRERRRTFEVGVASSFLWKSKFQQLVFNGPFKSQALDRYKVISFCRVHAPRGWQLMQSVS